MAHDAAHVGQSKLTHTEGRGITGITVTQTFLDSPLMIIFKIRFIFSE